MVEAALAATSGRTGTVPHHRGFVANDLKLRSSDGVTSDPRSVLLTGPNMGGKSTFCRQIAHIVFLAQARRSVLLAPFVPPCAHLSDVFPSQMGSFVPATAASIGVVDRVFSRVGASDDLSGHRSTFMCEMEETCNIMQSVRRRGCLARDSTSPPCLTHVWQSQWPRLPRVLWSLLTKLVGVHPQWTAWPLRGR